jgi:hypothetical protein
MAPKKMWSEFARHLGLFRARLDVTQSFIESSWSLSIK